MRIIDADKIIYFKGIDIFGEDAYMAPKDVIDEMPTIEAEPVRHGKWRQSKKYPQFIFCDECGEAFTLSNSMEHWNYCPNCGAKMDLDEVNDV